jgi:hypothetical protein
MSPNEFEKKVKDQPILSGLAKKKIQETLNWNYLKR